LFFLPAFVLLSLLAGVYLNYGDVPTVQGIFYAIKPPVVAVVLFAAWRIGSKSIKNGVLLGIAALAFIGILFFRHRLSVDRAGGSHSGRHRWQADAGQFKAGGGHGASNKATGRRSSTTTLPAGPRPLYLGQAVTTTLVFRRHRRGHTAGAARIGRALQHGRVLH